MPKVVQEINYLKKIMHVFLTVGYDYVKLTGHHCSVFANVGMVCGPEILLKI